MDKADFASGVHISRIKPNFFKENLFSAVFLGYFFW